MEAYIFGLKNSLLDKERVLFTGYHFAQLNANGEWLENDKTHFSEYSMHWTCYFSFQFVNYIKEVIFWPTNKTLFWNKVRTSQICGRYSGKWRVLFLVKKGLRCRIKLRFRLCILPKQHDTTFVLALLVFFC